MKVGLSIECLKAIRLCLKMLVFYQHLSWCRNRKSVKYVDWLGTWFIQDTKQEVYV